LDRERCEDAALRVVFVRNRSAEQSHDAVTEELVDRPFVAVHGVE
jgi:hypothetical protein